MAASRSRARSNSSRDGATPIVPAWTQAGTATPGSRSERARPSASSQRTRKASVEEVAQKARSGPDGRPAEAVGLVAQDLELEQVAGEGAAHLERAGERMRESAVSSRSSSVDSGVSWRSRESRISNVTLVAGIAGGHRLQFGPPAVVSARRAVMQRSGAVYGKAEAQSP